MITNANKVKIRKKSLWLRARFKHFSLLILTQKEKKYHKQDQIHTANKRGKGLGEGPV